MITLEVVKQVRALFLENRSQRKIAEIVDISRQTVATIIKGPMRCELIPIVDDTICEICGRNLPCIDYAEIVSRENWNRKEITKEEENEILKPLPGKPLPRLEGE